MIQTYRNKQGEVVVNCIDYDYYHFSQPNKSILDLAEFKNKEWNLFFIKKYIPLYLLDQLEIKYSTSLSEGGNNYVILKNFPYIQGNRSIYYDGEYFNPANIRTGTVMRFEQFIRFINFMLPTPNQEEMDFIYASWGQNEVFPFTLVCTYNIYYFFHHCTKIIGYPAGDSPEQRWLSILYYDYKVDGRFIDLYIESTKKKLFNNDKSK